MYILNILLMTAHCDSSCANKKVGEKKVWDLFWKFPEKTHFFQKKNKKHKKVKILKISEKKKLTFFSKVEKFEKKVSCFSEIFKLWSTQDEISDE